MIRLDLSDSEARILSDVLEQYSSNTRFEAARTDDHDYRADLHKILAACDGILERLKLELAAQDKAA